VKFWEILNPLPVYHSPPPAVIKGDEIDPVEPSEKLEVSQVVFVVILSLYFHELPLDDVGIFEYLPVPSFHDCYITTTFIAFSQY